jgi:micrococcal nuclease
VKLKVLTMKKPFILLIILGIAITVYIVVELVNVPSKNTAIVKRVIDGDTIELEDGRKVRLLGIDAPEKGKRCYEEAKERLRQLVEGKKVILEKDMKDEDVFGRLLRYVFVNDTFVNLELVKEGYAYAYIIDPNAKYTSEIEEAEELAKLERRCIWLGNITHDCVEIYYFHWNAKGDDCRNLDDEYVTFRNTCPRAVNMTGWIVKDEANNTYIFPRFYLESGYRVTLYTGSGTNSQTKLYWNSSGRACNAIWDNDGDTLYLFDSKKNLILSYTYRH